MLHIKIHPSAVGVDRDDISSACTYLFIHGLWYAMHVRRYIKLVDICNEYAPQSIRRLQDNPGYQQI